MSTPAAVNQRAQWGSESTPAVAAVANKTFRATSLTLGPKFEVGDVRPSGLRFKTVNYVKKEWSEGSLEGLPCFNELPDFFTWALGTPTVTDDGLGEETTAWTAGTGTTRTIQVGDDTRAAQVAGCFVKSFSLGWGRNSGDATLSADILGGRWNDESSLSLNPVSQPVSPVTAQSVTVSAATSRAALDTSPLADAIKFEFTTGDMRDAVWTLDAAFSSLSDIVPIAMDGAQVELLVKANATGRSFLTALRATDTWYIRLEAAGPDDQILTMEFAVQATDHTRADEDGVWAATVPLAIIQDASGFSHEFKIVAPTE